VLSYPGAAAHRVVQAKESVGRRWHKIGFSVAAILIVAVALVVWQFYMRSPTVEPASVEKMAYPLPDRPSIAVLPFDNMSGDPEQDYFSDGLTEQIISALSKVTNLFVIARNSVFTYKGKPVKVQQVSEELGVRYVLEGSVRKAGDEVRVTAQLVDALSGHHLWSETYDRNLKDIFAIQDEITMKILTALQVELTDGERARLIGKGTQNLKAYLKFLEGRDQAIRLNKEANFRAKQLLEEAIALDSNFGLVYAYLGYCHFFDAMYGWSKSPPSSIQRALDLAQKALSLDKSQPWPYTLFATIYTLQKQHVKAIANAEQAVELSPNLDNAVYSLGFVLRSAGRPEEGIPLLKKAIRLNPMPHFLWYVTLGRAYFLSGRYEEAMATYRKAVEGNADFRDAHVGLASTYAVLGREKEARSEAAEILRIDPSFSIKKFAIFMQFQVGIEPEIEGLRKAGLPEHPPLELPDRPSIAVLPFNNMSGDPEQEYFSDGITDDLITDLSRISGLFVIARNSTFQYKGKAVDLKRVGRELGVRYVLEGSVRKAGNTVRINAQLIDATTGGHLWAERYDEKLDNIFTLQDKITQKIVEALAVKLTIEERAIPKKETENLETYLIFLKGWQHYRRFTPDAFLEAIPLFEKAIELDPNYWRAYAALAKIYWETYERRMWIRKLGVTRDEVSRRAHKYLKLAMKGPTALAHEVATEEHVRYKDFEKAIAEAKRAVSLNPNDPDANFAMGFALTYAGRHKEAVESYKRAMRLDPFYQDTYGYFLGVSYFHMFQFEKAATLCERSSKSNPENEYPLVFLAASYAHLGRQQEAEVALAKLNEVNPHFFNLPNLPYIFRYKDPADYNLLSDGLRKAGMQ
jgi:adenylate cyclase